MSGEILTQRRRDAEGAEAIVARAPDVARAPSPLQQGRGGLATSCTFGFAIASEVCIGGNCEKYEVIGKKYLLVLRGRCDILLNMRDIRIQKHQKERLA